MKGLKAKSIQNDGSEGQSQPLAACRSSLYLEPWCYPWIWTLYLKADAKIQSRKHITSVHESFCYSSLDLNFISEGRCTNTIKEAHNECSWKFLLFMQIYEWMPNIWTLFFVSIIPCITRVYIYIYMVFHHSVHISMSCITTQVYLSIQAREGPLVTHSEAT